MKLNISFSSFKKKHLLKKDQLAYIVKKCVDYKKIENLFNFLLVEKNSFIFESVEKGTTKGRYTIIGLNPDKIWDINKNKIIEKFNKKEKIIKQKPLDFLNNVINNFNSKIPKNIPAMASMLVGYFSYDVIRYIENIPNKNKDDLKIPDVRLSRPKNLIIYDNYKKKIYYIENIYADNKIKNYYEKYESIKNKFKSYQHFENIKLPIKFNFNKNKNRIKSNISKIHLKKILLKLKNTLQKEMSFK